MKKTALVLGASGLVGKQLVMQLCNDSRYQKVTCLLRRPLAQGFFDNSYEKLEPIVINFSQLQEYQGYFLVDHVYVCLGTTIKQAGSKREFRKVDFEYVHIAAQLARAQRVHSFVWVSTVGANANSGSFYLRVKGELENAILTMSGLHHAAAVRPSLLLGQRQDSRILEQLGCVVAKFFAPFMQGKLAKYKPIEASKVATQMIQLQQF